LEEEENELTSHQKIRRGNAGRRRVDQRRRGGGG